MLEFRQGQIYSEEGAITCDRLSLCYTKKEDDLRAFPRPACSPYGDRKAYFGAETDGLGVSLTVKNEGAALVFTLVGDERFSEFGLNLPVAFMGKKGGNWEEQYLFNSPYRSEDNEHIYLYFTARKRKCLMLVYERPADGWKMDYSPYVGGHYFYNLKLLASFPREYGQGCKHRVLQFRLFEVASFEEGLQEIARLKGLPVALPKYNGGKLGEKVEISLFGACDRVVYGGESYPVTEGKAYLPLIEGTAHAYPYYGEKKGLDCTLYGYESGRALYKKYLDGIVRDGLNKPYDNLCEGQCWLSAMLRYMRKYGRVAEYERLTRSILDELVVEKEERGRKRFSILQVPHENYPAYHLFQSSRIQEQYFGVGILLDAYFALGEEKYLDYAIKTLDCALATTQKEDGRIEIYSAWLGVDEDYSTVTCLMLNIVDMGVGLKEINPEKSAYYLASAKRLAEYLYRRGLLFPTEGGSDSEAEREMEEGSIACTALSLLYYYDKVEKVEAYLTEALNILKLHDLWVVSTPLCCMQGSTLRWWETAWEGDEDGPALCMGHGWTIWRAEADYWAYKATGDTVYLDKARRGYTTNFAKIDKTGRSYAIYQIDYITGWRFFEDAAVRYELAKEFPTKHDNGLTGYVWSRAFDTEFLED